MRWFSRLRWFRRTPAFLPPAENAAPAEVSAPLAEAEVDVVPVAAEKTPVVEGPPPAVTATPIVIEPAVPAAAAEAPIIIDVTPAETAERIAEPVQFDEAAARARTTYFTPARYAGASATNWLLSPDMMYQLRREAPRRLSAPEMRPASEPVRVEHTTQTPALAYFTEGSELAEPPQSAPRGAVLTIDPFQLAVYFRNAEGSPSVPAETARRYLTEPGILALGKSLRDQALENWSSGKPPLSARGLFDFALSMVPHAGTALLACHNVTKAFSRGGAAITWLKIDRARPEYSSGANNIIAAPLHPAGMLRPGGMLYPSIFYLLFSAAELGTSDPGDWYRLFAAASLAWYTGSLRVDAGGAADTSIAANIELLLASRMMDTSVPSTPEYRSWAWLNALGFLEQAVYGRSQKRVAAAARVDLGGAVLGLSELARNPGEKWRWYVPHPGVWAAVAPAVDFRPYVAETLNSAGGLAK
ncbi:MAG TPA: hypothetical protein VKB88_23860 [Bryobacteraceae bacterium]|nr:hypothetical protein [Bryobacteraceae bacterium]